MIRKIKQQLGKIRTLRILRNNILVKFGYFKIIVKDFCFHCEKNTNFIAPTNIKLLTSSACESCGNVLRSNGIIKKIHDYLSENNKNIKEVAIYNLSADGSIHKYFKKYSYTCSEYFEDVRGGSFKNEIRSENLECLSFKNESFDIVISEEVFEHVNDYMSGFKSVQRVLKNEGVHFFTLPLHEKFMTEKPTFINYHGDSLRGKIIVQTEFGEDIDLIIDRNNEFKSKTFMHKLHHFTDNISKINTEEEFLKYLSVGNDYGQYYNYNNNIFMTYKL